MNKNGAVFVITLVILSIAVMVCAGLSTLMSRDVYTARRMRMSTQAYFLAEAGIEESIQDLYDNRFDFSNFPKNKNFDNGSFTATLDISKYTSERLVKITSLGRVGNTQRTVSATVADRRNPAFLYAALSGGFMIIGPGTVIQGDVHSNHPGAGAIINFGTIHGDVSALGTILNFGTINGTQTTGVSVTMPPFDASFWDYYYQKALASGTVYSGTQIFGSSLNPSYGVVWVGSGQARLNDTWTLTGCLITRTEPIIINFWTNGVITQTAMAGEPYGDFPALMSGSFIRIWDPTVINALVYAGTWLRIASLLGSGDVVINGALISNSWMRIGDLWNDNVRLNYVEPTPPGLTSPAPLEVVCWGS